VAGPAHLAGPVSGSGPLRVVLAGGGTAGHVEPAMALADAVRRRFPDAHVVALGTERGLETRLVPSRGYPLRLVPAVPIPRRLTPDLLRLPRRLSSAVAATRTVLADEAPDVVVGFGGYVAAPAYLAARRAGLPYVVHEANARPGWANRLGARGTPYVGVAAAGVALPHARVVGMPLRRAVATLDRAGSRATARAYFGLDPTAPVLLVSGGSQGARRLNDAVAAAAPALSAAGVSVLHVTGAAHLDAALAAVGGLPGYHAVAYVDRMELAYAAADLMVARAGAMTCAELAAVGLPAVYVPLPVGNGEQRLNAVPVVAVGGGVLVADADLDGPRLAQVAGDLLADPARLGAMAGAAASVGHRDGDERLLALVLTAAGAVAAGAR